MAESLMAQNWEPFIQNMVKKVHTPQLNLQTQKIKVIQEQLSELSKFERHLNDLQKTLRTLQDRTGLSERLVTPSKNDFCTVTAATNTPTGNYNVDVIQLATNTKLSSAQNVCAPLLPDNNLDIPLEELHLSSELKTGFFTINGTQIFVEKTDTVRSIFEKLSTLNIKATYDINEDKITLNADSSIYLGAANDTSNLLELFRLYTTGTSQTTSINRICTINLNHPITSESFKKPVSSGGTFKINGVEINYNEKDSLQNILSTINNSKANVTIHYTPSTQSFTLANKLTGSLGIAVEDVSGNLMQALGLTQNTNLTLGQNAHFKINDGTLLTSTSNSFTSDQHGISGLTLDAEKQGSSQFSIKNDTQKAIDTVQKFVSKYNEILDYLQKQTESDPKNKRFGTFHSNTEIKSFIRNFRNILFGVTSAQPEAPSNFERMATLGLTFDSSHHLLLDGNKLSEKIKNAPEQVSFIFSSNPHSPIKKSTTFLSSFLDNNFKAIRKTYNQQQDTLQRKLQQLQHQFSLQEDSWRKTFDQVSQVNSRIYSQMQAINALGKQN